MPDQLLFVMVTVNSLYDVLVSIYDNLDDSIKAYTMMNIGVSTNQ